MDRADHPLDPALPRPSAVPPAAEAPATGAEPMLPLVSPAAVNELRRLGLRPLDVFRGSTGPRQAVLCSHMSGWEAGWDKRTFAAVVDGKSVLRVFPDVPSAACQFPSTVRLVEGRHLPFLERRDGAGHNGGYYSEFDFRAFDITEAELRVETMGNALVRQPWRLEIDPSGRACKFFEDNDIGTIVWVVDFRNFEIRACDCYFEIVDDEDAWVVTDLGTTGSCGTPRVVPFGSGEFEEWAARELRQCRAAWNSAGPDSEPDFAGVFPGDPYESWT
jgi:hypothetical protein